MRTITGHKRHLEALCKKRGYTLQEIMPCVVSRQGNTWTVNPWHPAYPRYSRLSKPSPPPPLPPMTGGPGSELKVLLKNWLGITANPNCSCNAKARQMDEWGCEVCEQRIEQIVDWLGDEARRRKLPFMRMAATQLVKLAIRRARKAASRAADGGHKSIEGTDFDE